MTCIYPDTNIFLHCKHFEQIDWQHIAGKNTDYSVVIAQVVINERDKHKYSSHAKRQSITLDPIFVHFENIRQVKGIGIDYKILVDNLPQPATGELNVHFEFK